MIIEPIMGEVCPICPASSVSITLQWHSALVRQPWVTRCSQIIAYHVNIAA